MISINVPELKSSNILEFLVTLEDCVKSGGEVDYCFDFSLMRTFQPLAMLVFGSKIKELGKIPNKHFYFKNYKEQTYAGTMGFFRYVSRTFPFGKDPGQAAGSRTYIPITRLKVERLRERDSKLDVSLEDYSLVEREAKRLASVLSPQDIEFQGLLSYLIREALRNIPEHACTNEMWICAQHWNWNNETEVAIADEGIGVWKSLSQQSLHSSYVIDNKSALEWALKAGISQAAPHARFSDDFANSGYGLYMISRICLQLQGSFILASGGDYVKIDELGIHYGKTSYNGTAVSIRLKTQENFNYKKLVLDISVMAENEAKLINNAHKMASYPSRCY